MKYIIKHYLHHTKETKKPIKTDDYNNVLWLYFLHLRRKRLLTHSNDNDIYNFDYELNHSTGKFRRQLINFNYILICIFVIVSIKQKRMLNLWAAHKPLINAMFSLICNTYVFLDIEGNSSRRLSGLTVSPPEYEMHSISVW